MAKILMKGNEAIAEAAVRAGCEAYYGYPITPQTEVLEYMARRMPELGRAFVQAESEVSAVNMIYGAATAGVRAMSSTSSPGFSLMQEGISYIVCSEVPAVLVNVMRGGPGLGNIQPAQSDYTQMVKGGGHGDYHSLVLAPATIQETVDHVILAFDLAEKYRTLVMVMADGMLGQMMEPVELPAMRPLKRMDWDWALRGSEGRPKRVITSLYLGETNLEAVNLRLQARLKEIVENEQRWELFLADDAEILIVAFGTAARIAKTAIHHARDKGIKVGLFRPITVFPYPYRALGKAAQGKKLLVFELNAGQMLEDVRLATQCAASIAFFGKMGGVVPLPDDVLAEIEKLTQEDGD
ncbi:MAG: 3-methyl-2-oxobutanoate dehydrogenase subunit VorB [Anaerolineae bacterium]|nr:3-methyl-2-oxobutanoate dehydrogenase subunit VorB [Anaerolineae bacterium]